MAYSNYMDCETSYTLAGVKCGSADVRILNMQNADVVADENPHFTHIHENLILIVFPDSNPVAYWIDFWLFMYLYI